MTYYVYREEIEAFAIRAGFSDWTKYDLDTKNQITFFANDDIEIYHNQLRVVGIPWEISNIDIIEAVKHQALYIGRVFNEQKFAEKTKAKTDGSYSAGSITVDAKKRREIEPMAKRLVDSVLIVKNKQRYRLGRG